ncbi:MAG: DUF922 domain-containing protein [Paludibacteraceae bacterium]|nr:DUF922 domain-containing protein [Paludibacteraceae bacterium]
MNKIGVLILFLGAIISSYANDNEFADTAKYIPYSDTVVVTWNDFRGEESSTCALTYCQVSLLSQIEGCNVVFDLKTYMVKEKSMKLKDHYGDELLNHEKAHFQITEIYSRYMRKEISEIKLKELSDINKEVNQIFNKYSKQSREFQILYDKETKHSQDKDKQRKWEKKVNSLLKETSKYSDTKITVEFDCKK